MKPWKTSKGSMRSRRLQKGRTGRQKATRKMKDNREVLEEAQARRATEHGVGDGGG